MAVADLSSPFQPLAESERVDPGRAANVPLEDIPAMLVRLAAQQGEINAAQQVLSARLLAERNGDDDHLLTAEQAAEKLSTTVDYLYRHKNKLPFIVPLSRGQVRFSAKGIQRYIASRVKNRKS